MMAEILCGQVGIELGEFKFLAQCRQFLASVLVIGIQGEYLLAILLDQIANHPWEIIDACNSLLFEQKCTSGSFQMNFPQRQINDLLAQMTETSQGFFRNGQFAFQAIEFVGLHEQRISVHFVQDTKDDIDIQGNATFDGVCQLIKRLGIVILRHCKLLSYLGKQKHKSDGHKERESGQGPEHYTIKGHSIISFLGMNDISPTLPTCRTYIWNLLSMVRIRSNP